jgi:hypothetical protein
MAQVKRLVASAVAAAALAFASSASAIVAEWSASFENGFQDNTSFDWNGVAISESGATTVGGLAAWTSLRWPGSGNQSGLDVTPGAIGGVSSVSVFTNVLPPVDTIQITHLNRVITCDQGSPTTGSICLNALKDTVLLTQLALTAIDFPGPGMDTPLGPLAVRMIGIRFVETLNSGPCGFPEQSGPACSDIFVTAPLDLSFSFVFLDGIKYFVEVGAEGLIDLSDEACAKVGVAAGCVGVVTQEGQDTPVLANIRIFTAPEPGTPAILALGLLGLGFVTRRKRA